MNFNNTNDAGNCDFPPPLRSDCGAHTLYPAILRRPAAEPLSDVSVDPERESPDAWELIIGVPEAVFTRIAASLVPPRQFFYLKDSSLGWKFLVVVGQYGAIQQRLILPLLGRDAADFMAHMQNGGPVQVITTTSDYRMSIIVRTRGRAVPKVRLQELVAPIPLDLVPALLEIMAIASSVDDLRAWPEHSKGLKKKNLVTSMCVSQEFTKRTEAELAKLGGVKH